MIEAIDGFLDELDLPKLMELHRQKLNGIIGRNEIEKVRDDLKLNKLPSDFKELLKNSLFRICRSCLWHVGKMMKYHYLGSQQGSH